MLNEGIRFATTEEEKEAVYRLRYDLYVAEMGRMVDLADHQRRLLADPLDATSRSMIAVKDGVAVGTMRVHWGADGHFPDLLRTAYSVQRFSSAVDDAQVCIVERLMVRADSRDGSITSAMFAMFYQFVIRQGVELVLLDCEPHLLNRWLALGFRPFAVPFTWEGIGLVVPMAGVVWDLAHLRKMQSPLLMALDNEGEEHQRTVQALVAVLPQRAPVRSQILGNEDQFLKEICAARAQVPSDRPSMFDKLTESDIARCTRRSHIIECAAGDAIITEGNAAKTMFLVLDGAVEIRRLGKLLALESTGAVFGEIAFLLGEPRTADVFACVDGTRLLSLNENELRQLIAEDAALAARLLLNLSRCLCARMMDARQ